MVFPEPGAEMWIKERLKYHWSISVRKTEKNIRMCIIEEGDKGIERERKDVR